jgi:hypothetical protein
VSKTAAILSLLHQDAIPASATRQFRQQSVLAWTLSRLSQCESISRTAILAWDDQVSSLASFDNIISLPRLDLPSMHALSASRRWADGWRGGLLSTTCFDLGFHGPSLLYAMNELNARQIVFIDPDSALIDSAIVDSLISACREPQRHRIRLHPRRPGQAAILLRGLVEKLLHRHYPGRLSTITRSPARPIALPACTRAHGDFSRLNDSPSTRQQISHAENHPSSQRQLIKTDSQELLKSIRSAEANHSRVTLRRKSTPNDPARPIYSPLRHTTIDRRYGPRRSSTNLFTARRLRRHRLTIAGLGDPCFIPGS